MKTSASLALVAGRLIIDRVRLGAPGLAVLLIPLMYAANQRSAVLPSSGFNYEKAIFDVVDIHPKPFDEQLRLMAMLKQAAYFERGQRVFQCWRHVDVARGAGAWMLVFYECFGFFVWHINDETAFGSGNGR